MDHPWVFHEAPVRVDDERICPNYALFVSLSSRARARASEWANAELSHVHLKLVVHSRFHLVRNFVDFSQVLLVGRSAFPLGGLDIFGRRVDALNDARAKLEVLRRSLRERGIAKVQHETSVVNDSGSTRSGAKPGATGGSWVIGWNLRLVVNNHAFRRNSGWFGMILRLDSESHRRGWYRCWTEMWQ